MRIYLVDDDSVQLEYMKEVISKWSNKNNVDTELSFYHSVEELYSPKMKNSKMKMSLE